MDSELRRAIEQFVCVPNRFVNFLCRALQIHFSMSCKTRISTTWVHSRVSDAFRSVNATITFKESDVRSKVKVCCVAKKNAYR